MSLGMEVGFGPGHIMLDGNQAPLTKKGAQPPIFGPCLLWPNGWMDQDAIWYDGIGIGSDSIVLDADPAPPQGAQLPIFGLCRSIVVKRSPISATAEQLFHKLTRLVLHNILCRNSYSSRRMRKPSCRRSTGGATLGYTVDEYRVNAYSENNSSAAAEMGYRLATIDMGRKVRELLHPFPLGSWIPI